MHDYERRRRRPQRKRAAGSALQCVRTGKHVGRCGPAVACPAPTGAPSAINAAGVARGVRAPTPPAASARSATERRPRPHAEPPQPLHVTTDVLDIVINLKGGELDQADLLKYPLRKDTPNIPVRLLELSAAADPVPAAERTHRHGRRSGAHASGGLEIRPEDLSFLRRGANELRVPLTWTDGQGLTVTKTFIFTRGQYAIGLDYDVKNAGQRAAQAGVVFADSCATGNMPRAPISTSRPIRSRGRPCMTARSPRISMSRATATASTRQTITNGWLASLQHQFVVGHRAARESALPISAAGSRSTNT